MKKNKVNVFTQSLPFKLQKGFFSIYRPPDPTKINTFLKN